MSRFLAFVPCLLVLLCIGCASLSEKVEELPKPELPKTAKDVNKVVENTCKAATALCNVYESLPPESRNASDDSTCKDARKFCDHP